MNRNFMGISTSFLYDGVNPVQELNGTTVTANLLTGGVDERFLRTTASETNNYLTDALGSTIALTNSSGNSTVQYSYSPYGSINITGTTTNSYTYAGREIDGLGINYYRARYRNPTTGRFISEDPAGFAGGINMYVYAHDDSINRSDPSGLWDTYTHHALFWNALRGCGVSNSDIWQMQQESDFVDLVAQSPDDAFEHSMRAPWQSAQSALQARDAWIAQNLNMAAQEYQLYGDTASASNPTDSWLTPFADALHTITDSTSPAHMQSGVPIAWPSYPNVFEHGDESKSIETWANMTPALMQQNIAMIQAAYMKVTGRSCGCHQ